MSKPRIIEQRWWNTPPLLGCRWCGYRSKVHGRRTVPGHPDHVFTPPTMAQAKARYRVYAVLGRG